MRIRLPLWILAGALVGVFSGVLIVHILTLQVRVSQLESEIARSQEIVAPYYEKEAFQRPSFVKKSAEQTGIKIPIIMYHYVEYTRDAQDLVRRRLTTSPALFEGHLRALKQAGYETYFVKDIPDILEGNIEYSTRSAVLTFDDGYEDFYTQVFPLLKKYHSRATVYVVSGFVGRNGFLNKKQLSELTGSGLVEIGSHTLDHVYLKTMSGENARNQIHESKKELERITGSPIETFAYPYGAFNEETPSLVMQAGYRAAVTVLPGTIQSSNNVHLLFRIRPGAFTPQTMISVIEHMKQ